MGAHQTMGVDMFVTSERIVMLDTQVKYLFGFVFLSLCRPTIGTDVNKGGKKTCVVSCM